MGSVGQMKNFGVIFQLNLCFKATKYFTTSRSNIVMFFMLVKFVLQAVNILINHLKLTKGYKVFKK